MGTVEEPNTSVVAPLVAQLSLLPCFTGRMPRRLYWGLHLGLGGLGVLASGYSIIFPTVRNDAVTSASITVAAAGMVFGWLSFTALVRRLHDIGLSGWWALLPGTIGLAVKSSDATDYHWGLQATAAAGIFLTTLLKGASGPNRFGPDPRGRSPTASGTDPRPDVVRQIDLWTIRGLAMTGVVPLFAGSLAGTAGSILPSSWMMRVGEGTVAQHVPPHYRCQAPAARAALDRLAIRLGPVRDLRIVFTSHPHVQGLAVPGGVIVVGQDVVRLARSPDEVAGLMAHELAHVRLRHPEQILAARIALALSPISLLHVLETGLTTSYSRQSEREADALAIETLTKAGIDPRHLGMLLTRIENDRRLTSIRRSDSTLSWLSTHPQTVDRVAAISQPPPAFLRRRVMSSDDWAAIQQGCVGSGQPR